MFSLLSKALLYLFTITLLLLFFSVIYIFLSQALEARLQQTKEQLDASVLQNEQLEGELERRGEGGSSPQGGEVRAQLEETVKENEILQYQLQVGFFFIESIYTHIFSFLSFIKYK